jgi:hypothetical protein
MRSSFLSIALIVVSIVGSSVWVAASGAVLVGAVSGALLCRFAFFDQFVDDIGDGVFGVLGELLRSQIGGGFGGPLEEVIVVCCDAGGGSCGVVSRGRHYPPR